MVKSFEFGVLDEQKMNSDLLLRTLAGMFNEPSNAPGKSDHNASPSHQTSPNLQDRYRALVEQLPAVVFMAPLDGGIGEAYVSPQIEQALGFTQEEWLGDPVLWYRQIHPDDKARWSAEAAQMLMTGNALKSTYRVLSRDGRVIWLHCEARMMRSPDGRPWFIHGVGFDVTELKQTEEALQTERNFVSAILDTTRALVVVLDGQGRIVRCNRACEQITGYAFAAVKDKYVWDVFVAPADFQPFQEILRQTFADEREHEGEAQWITRHGDTRAIAWSSGVLRGQGGEPSFTILTGIDITERKRLEQRELQREADRVDETLVLLQRLIDSMSEALLLVDTSGRIIRTNRAATRLLHSADSEIVGHPISDLLVNPEIPLTPDDLLAGHPQGKLYLETEVRTHSGADLSVSISCSTVTDRSGNNMGLLLVIRDITERRQAEEVRSRLAAIVESSDDAIIGKDLNGIITSWNAAASRLFGYSPEEAIGKSVLLLIPPELQHEEPEILRRIRKGERIEHFESQRLTKDGRRIEVSLSISPVRDGTGKLIGASKIARDITGRKQAEEALRKSEKLAAAGRLAASIAHEINNPLAAVTNLLYLMGKHPEKSGRYLQLATQELDRVIHISRQTLGFYRDTSVPTQVNLSELLESVMYIYARRLEGREIKVTTDYDPDAVVVALAGEIRQVCSNLISNALDAMPSGGMLTVKVSRSRSWKHLTIPGVRVTVADTGMGIPREHAAKIFEPFYTTKIDVGTGLGLWVSHGIIQKHHGSMRFRSRTSLGKSGTVFSVFLPEGTLTQERPDSERIAS
jgi:PAS domain S-box-containing protein